VTPPERLALDEPKRRHTGGIGEQADPAPEDDGIDEQAVLVDEPARDRCMDESHAAGHDDVR
jgi:hypothetical protein